MSKIVHGEKRLLEEINDFCYKCSTSRSVYEWCYIKNQKACEKIQEEFGDRIIGEQKDEYVRRSMS